MTLKSRLKKARANKGLSQEELAKAIGKSQGTIAALESGRNSSTTTIATIAKVLDVDAVWLETGQGNMSPVFFNFDSKEELPDGYIRFNVLNVTARLGDGHINPENIEIVDTVTVAETWARQNLGACYRRIEVISTKGDSMAETIKEGDVLFVDSGIQYFDGDGIYVLYTPDGLRAKRLQRTVTGGILVISDNPQYRDEQLSAEQTGSITICGKVKGAWSLSVF